MMSSTKIIELLSKRGAIDEATDALRQTVNLPLDQLRGYKKAFETAFSKSEYDYPYLVSLGIRGLVDLGTDSDFVIGRLKTILLSKNVDESLVRRCNMGLSQLMDSSRNKEIMSLFLRKIYECR